MRLRNFSSEAIVLSRKNYGEADRLLIIYSKNFGKLSLLAKGVRKPKSRKRGHIEIFSHIRFSVSSGRGIPLMTEAEIIDSFRSIRTNLKKVSVAYFIVETILKTTRDEEENRELFNVLRDTLNLLKNSDNLKKLRHEFINRILVVLGYWPEGEKLIDPDRILEEVTERSFSTIRVGKKVLA